MKILIVDDFEMVRVMLKTTLDNMGETNSIQAEDGKSALEHLQQAAAASEPFDVVFADWNMPIMNGFELLQACKANDLLKETPIIMVTAEADKSHIMKALMGGAADYIVKPFSPEAIQKKIESIAEKMNQVG